MGQNKFRLDAPYKTEDLNEPIVFLKAKNVPNTEDESWHLKVKPYAEAFAAMDEGSKRPGRGEEQENEAVHIFAIRFDPTLPLEMGDYIVHEDIVYVTSSVKKIRGRVEFLEIKTTVFSKVASAGLETDNTITVESKPAAAGTNPWFTDDA